MIFSYEDLNKTITDFFHTSGTLFKNIFAEKKLDSINNRLCAFNLLLLFIFCEEIKRKKKSI